MQVAWNLSSSVMMAPATTLYGTSACRRTSWLWYSWRSGVSKASRARVRPRSALISVQAGLADGALGCTAMRVAHEAGFRISEPQAC